MFAREVRLGEIVLDFVEEPAYQVLGVEEREWVAVLRAVIGEIAQQLRPTEGGEVVIPALGKFVFHPHSRRLENAITFCPVRREP